MWKTGKTIIDNSELLIGRMYRKFLDPDTVQDNQKVSIRMLAFELDNPSNKIVEKYGLPNDPGYLMAKTSCPAPFDNKPMFKIWEGAGVTNERIVDIKFRDKLHQVKIRFSYAREEARITNDGSKAGDKPYGKHAAKNIGVSIIRAGRELDLDQSLVIKYNTRERWWGIEVEFPPSLDDLFGVTNNKQSARNFTELMGQDIETLLKDSSSITKLKDELREQEDPREPLLEIAQIIKNNLSTIRKAIENQRKGTGNSKKNQRYQGATPEKRATRVTENRQHEGYKGESDKDESLPAKQRQVVIEQTLTDIGVPETKAKELAATTVSDNSKYTFAEADLETAAFFSVKPKGGAIVVTLNTNHSAYENLVEVLEEDMDNVDAETLRARLAKSQKGLKLLLAAWARYEDEQPDGKRRQDIRDVRVDWGRIARQFLESEE